MEMNPNIKRIRDFMSPDVKTVPLDHSVFQVVKIMKKEKIGAVIVVNAQDLPVGIFTERDLLLKVVSVEMPLTAPVSEVMSSNMVCVELDDDIQDVPRKMLDGHFRHLPVLDNFKLVGMLSIRDVVSYLMDR
jgi:CBS domain-containing protein